MGGRGAEQRGRRGEMVARVRGMRGDVLAVRGRGGGSIRALVVCVPWLLQFHFLIPPRTCSGPEQPRAVLLRRTGDTGRGGGNETNYTAAWKLGIECRACAAGQA